jgi:hypothetical protein
MGPSTFLKLCNILNHNELLNSSHYVRITKQVATFLLVVKQGHTHRDMSDRIQRSTETVNKYCHINLKAVCKLGKTIIRPATMQMSHMYVMKDNYYYLWFEVSAIKTNIVFSCKNLVVEM